MFVYEFENVSKITSVQASESIDVIKKRLHNFGLDAQINQNRDKTLSINIKANDLDNERVSALILNQGKLEFWELYNADKFYALVNDIESMGEEKIKSDSIVDLLFSRVMPPSYQDGAVIFQAKVEDTAKVNALLNNKDSKYILPSAYSNFKYLWGIPDNGYLPLYTAKSNRNNTPALTGECIVSASQEYGTTGRPVISITMNEYGGLRWEKITGKAYTNNTCIAITMNDLVYSAPSVTMGPISGGKSSISGNFTLEEAQDLATILSSGKSIPKLKLVKSTKPKN